MITLLTEGIRHDLDDFFRLNLPGEEEPHHPYLVITVNPATDDVIIHAEPRRKDVLLLYPDATMVLQQWPGKWRSDFFLFTVGQLKAALAAKGK